MSRIRSSDTKPEVAFRKLLFAKGYRYRKNVSYIPGHPDLYLARYNTAIFVHGCFWHRHQGCKYAYMPKSRAEFWQEKFEKNVHRDETVKRELKEQNIKCLIVWECTVRKMLQNKKFATIILQEAEDFLSNTDVFKEI